jgi:ABC-2 type transport system ATP-binding protein
VISVKNLRKSFQIHKKKPGLLGSVKSLFQREWSQVEALKGVNLEVGACEILGLLGANGAGKTTLVKILAGIIHPTEGEVSVLGFSPWERDDDFRRQISLIMGQKAQLWWDLPAADSFELLKEIYEVPKDQFNDTLDYLVQTLDVRGQLNTQLRRLSLGERMKMELIAALLHRPKVVFLDEPTIGLDLTAQRAIRQFITEYRNTFKPAMILTSHYMEDIEALCERVAVIKEGALVYDGRLQQVVDQFVDERLVTFVFREGETAPNSYAWSGEVISSDKGLVKVKIKKSQVAATVTKVMSDLPIHDLKIEERDVADVIESMIRVRPK